MSKKPVLTVTREKRDGIIYRTVELTGGGIKGMSQQASQLMVEALITTMSMQFQQGLQDTEAAANKIRARLPGVETLLEVCDFDQDTLTELMQ